MSAAIAVEQAVVLLAGFPALTGADLTVEQGSITLLQGPNGAGKTTLLRLLAGLAPLSRGSARVLGRDIVAQRREVRGLVGLLGPSSMLYEDLTVRENLEFWARVNPKRTYQTDAVVERLDLGATFDQRVRDLSTGQRRRASIAAVVVRRPSVWLLDEPHAGLDQQGRNIIDDLIIDAAAAGASVIVASHELDRVRVLASSVATIAGGLVIRHEQLGGRHGSPRSPFSPGESGA